MNNRVELVFDKSLSSLAGYDYGLKIYNEQVKGKIDFYNQFEMVFPPQIKNVASSFVQGLFEDIVDTIGLKKTEENTIIVSDKEDFSKTVLMKLR